MLVFEEGGETGGPGEKTLGARMRVMNKLNPYMTPSPGIVSKPHWWEASALTTAPSLLPYTYLPLSKSSWSGLFRCIRCDLPSSPKIPMSTFASVPARNSVPVVTVTWLSALKLKGSVLPETHSNKKASHWHKDESYPSLNFLTIMIHASRFLQYNVQQNLHQWDTIEWKWSGAKTSTMVSPRWVQLTFLCPKQWNLYFETPSLRGRFSWSQLVKHSYNLCNYHPY